MCWRVYMTFRFCVHIISLNNVKLTGVVFTFCALVENFCYSMHEKLRSACVVEREARKPNGITFPALIRYTVPKRIFVYLSTSTGQKANKL